MRALRLLAKNSPLEVVEMPELSPGPDEVKIAIEASGICHSDAHYRAGFGDVAFPRTPGHEVAGVVAAVGDNVSSLSAGDRVAVHYLVSCGECWSCTNAGEQFCEVGQMIGKHRDGGYAESIVVPAVNAIPIPPNVSFTAAAIMMCSTATAYHALRLANVGPGTKVAILGFGGLGVSALHLSRVLGAERIAAVDVIPAKLAAAEALGAVPIDSRRQSVTAELNRFDVALDFTGRPEVSVAALRALAPGGRLVLVALSEAQLPFNPYRDVLGKERRIVGCSDHLREELFDLMRFASEGGLDLSTAISRRVALDARAVNGALDELDRGSDSLRSVIEPRS